MIKPKVKIKLTDFWMPEEEIMNLHLFQIFLNHFDVQLSNEPDILFFSVFGQEHLQYDCLKIFYTGENVNPDYRYCDFSFSFEPTSAKNFQYPVFAIKTFFPQFRDQQYTEDMWALKSYPKTRFCNFVYKNPIAKERIKFCRKLMTYQAVDCPGVVLNNMPPIPHSRNWQLEKLHFMKRHKFSIAFENQSAPNYITEKIFHALLVGTIPIYFGDPDIDDYFNPDSFINCYDYTSFDDVVKHVIEVDNNKALYHRYITAPPLLPNSRIHAISEDAIAERFRYIVRQKEHIVPVSKKRLFQIRRWSRKR